MKKVYLSILLCCFGFVGFSATWYSQDSLGLGNANNLNHWWSGSDSTGTHPTTFTDAGDLWVMQTDMHCIGNWAIGGSLVIPDATFTGPSGSISIGGNMTMFGASNLQAAGALHLVLYGNLSVLGAAYIYNSPSYTTIEFSNTSSSLASPQMISWTSTASTGSTYYVQLLVDANCVLQMITDVTLPDPTFPGSVVNGTLVCDNQVLHITESSYPFQLNSGASLYTANPGGIDASVDCDFGYSYSSQANYAFNGTSPQVTGSLMPSSLYTGGSAIINNGSGVELTQTTTFDNGSTLALTNGQLTIGSNNVILGIDNSLTGTFSSAAMIVANGSGMVTKRLDEEGNYLFPIGDNSGNYSPIDIEVTGGSYSGSYVSVNVTKLKHPNNANLTNYLNRFWTVLTSGSLDYFVDSATYVPGDVVGSEANLSMGQYIGSLPWLKYGPAVTASHTLSSDTMNYSESDFTGISTPLPAITLTPDMAYCYGGGPVTLNVLSATVDTPASYSWAPATGLSVTTGTSVVADPAVGVTAYTVTVTDANGFSNSATVTLTVNALPTGYDVTGGGPYCDHSGGLHIGLEWSDPGIRYQLLRNDTAVGGPLDGIDGELDFGADTLEGAYTIVATDTLTGCTNVMNNSAGIEIIPNVVPSVTVETSISDTICEGTMISFSADPTNGGTEPYYQWRVNDTLVASGPGYSYIPVNGDVVKVILHSNAQCALPDSAIGTRTMTVSAHMMPTITLTASPNDTVCEGTGVTINALTTFAGTAPTFLWIKNTLPVSTDSAYSFIPSDNDGLYCVLTSNYFCRTTSTAYSNVIVMTVESPVIPAVDIIAVRGTTVGRAQPDTFIAVVSNGGVNPSYQWYRNGTAVAGATTAIYTRPSFTDKDSVSVIVTRRDACAMNTFNSVIVSVTTVDVNQLAAGNADIKLIPNPNNGTFTVKGSLATATDQEVTIEITDVLGQVIYKNKSMTQNGDINAPVQLNNTVANGTYLMNLRSGNVNTTMRFVISQ